MPKHPRTDPVADLPANKKQHTDFRILPDECVRIILSFLNAGDYPIPWVGNSSLFMHYIPIEKFPGKLDQIINILFNTKMNLTLWLERKEVKSIMANRPENIPHHLTDKCVTINMLFLDFINYAQPLFELWTETVFIVTVRELSNIAEIDNLMEKLQPQRTRVEIIVNINELVITKPDEQANVVPAFSNGVESSSIINITNNKTFLRYVRCEVRIENYYDALAFLELKQRVHLFGAKLITNLLFEPDTLVKELSLSWISLIKYDIKKIHANAFITSTVINKFPNLKEIHILEKTKYYQLKEHVPDTVDFIYEYMDGSVIFSDYMDPPLITRKDKNYYIYANIGALSDGIALATMLEQMTRINWRSGNKFKSLLLHAKYYREKSVQSDKDRNGSRMKSIMCVAMQSDYFVEHESCRTTLLEHTNDKHIYRLRYIARLCSKNKNTCYFVYCLFIHLLGLMFAQFSQSTK